MERRNRRIDRLGLRGGQDFPVEGERDPRLIDHEDGTQSLSAVVAGRGEPGFDALALFAVAQMANTIREERDRCQFCLGAKEGSATDYVLACNDCSALLFDIRKANNSPVQEMRVCEIAHLILRPGQLYRFSIDPECPGCAAYGGGDYELTLDAVPAARRLL